MESGGTAEIVERWPAPGGETWVNAVRAPIWGEDGGIEGVIGIFWDISDRLRLEEEQKRSYREKEILLHEVNHRVKNNLQLISAMLRLESDGTQNAEIAAFVKDTVARISSISTIHEMLYITDNVAEIAVGEYLREICRNLVDMYSTSRRVIRIMVEAQDHRLDLNRMVPLGLIANEMVTNSLKYAFPGRDLGTIAIRMEADEAGGRWRYRFKDDGIGLPPGFDAEKARSLGMVFIRSLVDQLGGGIVMRNDGGLEYELDFPVKRPS
jgi:two-component sensor histidine kinase